MLYLMDKGEVMLMSKSIREFISKIKNKNGVFLGYVHFLARERFLGWIA